MTISFKNEKHYNLDLLFDVDNNWVHQKHRLVINYDFLNNMKNQHTKHLNNQDGMKHQLRVTLTTRMLQLEVHLLFMNVP